MKTFKDQWAASAKAAQDIIDGAKGRDLSEDESTEVDAHLEKANDYRAKHLAQEKARKQRDAVAGLTPDEETPSPEPESAKSLGEHFAKSVGADNFTQLKERGGFSVSAPEFKAASDPQATPGAFAPVLTQVDRAPVQAYRRPLVSDLLGQGNLGAGTNAVTYFVEGAVEGAFTTVAAGGQKPQIHIGDPTPKTDALKKIAAFFDSHDEMVEDVDWWVSEINNRGLYLLSLTEEAQLLQGDGTGSNVQGLLNRSGLQTETQAASDDSAQDAIFRAITKVQTATGLSADGIIINPADYQALRLSRDSNEQYYGGGFFAGQYGNGGVPLQPPLWGVNTVVSAAVPAKTVVVGALKAATTVYRKGGVRVESTNSDLGKFTKNIVTTRIEERVALAVRIPAAVVNVTLV